MRSQKDRLRTGQHFDTVWRQERQRRPHLKHSVLLLILSPRRDQIALVTPQSKAERIEVMLPQHRCVRDVIGVTEAIAPSQAIRLLRRDVLQEPEGQRLCEIGHGYVHTGELSGRKQKHSRMVYAYGAQVPAYDDFLLQSPTEHYQLRWCGVSELMALPVGQQIAPRKFELIMQSIVELHGMLGKTDGKLLAAAHAELRMHELL